MMSSLILAVITASSVKHSSVSKNDLAMCLSSLTNKFSTALAQQLHSKALKRKLTLQHFMTILKYSNKNRVGAYT